MKNAIYVRVSTDKQDEGMQRHNIKEFLDNLEINYDDCIEYVDHAISGSEVVDRANYQRLLNDVNNGQVKQIFCYEWSRLWRDLEEQNRALKVFRALDIKVISTTEGIIDSIDDELKANIIGSINQHERKRMLKRSKDGMKSKAQKCAEVMHRATEEGWTLEELEQHPDFWSGRRNDKRVRSDGRWS